MSHTIDSLGEETKRRLFTGSDHPLKRLTITYITVVILILIMITAKQGLVTFAIAQERVERASALSIVRQNSRAILFLQDTLLLQEHLGNQETIRSEIVSMDNAFETVQQAALDPNGKGASVLGLPFWAAGFPSSVVPRVKESEPSYTAIDNAVKEVVRAQEGADLSPEIVVLTEQIPLYRAIFSDIFNTLNQQADTQVIALARIEGALYILTVIAVIFEVFVIIRPTMKDLRAIIEALLKQISDESEGRVPPLT